MIYSYLILSCHTHVLFLSAFQDDYVGIHGEIAAAAKSLQSCLTLFDPTPSVVILKSKKVKYVIVSTFSPSICHEVMGQDAIVRRTSRKI